VSDGRFAWMAQALCRGMDPELWFPERGSIADDLQAKKVCSGCPARSKCLDYALDNGERHGIWGGLSERERRRIRLQRNLDKARRCRTCGLLRHPFAYDGSSPDCALCVSRREEATRRTG
jgi:WhiB family transcriptional regulator, redox-sensing transcriptional regulator